MCPAAVYLNDVGLPPVTSISRAPTPRTRPCLWGTVDRLYRRIAEHLCLLYERMRPPLGIGIKKTKR